MIFCKSHRAAVKSFLLGNITLIYMLNLESRVKALFPLLISHLIKQYIDIDMTRTMQFSTYNHSDSVHQCHCKHRKCGLCFKVILIGALLHHLDIWPKQFRGKSPLPMRTKYVKYILLWQDRWMASLAFISAVLFRNSRNIHHRRTLQL